MPSDSRRLPVPDNSKPPHTYSPKVVQVNTNLAGGEKRKDGRELLQHRPIFIKAGVVSQAKGSAYMEMNNTKVICSVYGPREVTRREDFSMKGQLLCEFKYATFSCHTRRSHQQDRQDKDYSIILLEALEPAVQLEKFPKARMDVFVTVLEDDGSCLAAALTAASVALADAGIEMYDLVVACSMRQIGDTKIIDPLSCEEYENKTTEKQVENSGCITVGLMPTLNQVAALVQKGEMTSDSLTQGIRFCLDVCHKLYPVIQQCLVKAVKNKLKHSKS